MKIKKIVTLVLSVLMLTVFVYANETKAPVRVAYYSLGDYFQTDDDGNIQSFDAEYLNLVSEYSGLEFQYVNCKTWSNAFSMLENGEIDLLGTMQYTDERAEKFDMCKREYGVTVSEIVATEDSEIEYEDYEKLGNAKIGIINGYVREQSLRQLLAEKNISPDFFYYNTQEELEGALKNGEVDVIACNAHVIGSQYKVVEKYCYSPFFFATWKGNKALADEIDAALVKIEVLNPDFSEKKMSRYFPNIVKEPLTKAEIDFVAANPNVVLYLDPNASPVSYLDRQSGEMKGMLVDVCKIIGRNTGLDFTFKSQDSTDRKAIDASVVYSISGEFGEKYAVPSNVSSGVFDGTLSLYHKAGKEYSRSESKNYVVALPKDCGFAKKYLKSMYKNYSFISVEDCEAAINLVRSNRATLALCDTYEANEVLTEKNVTDVVPVPTFSLPFDLGLSFGSEDYKIISSIVNKGIAMTDKDEIENIVLKYSLAAVPEATLEYFVRNNTDIAFICTAVVLIFLVIIAIAVTYSVIMHLQKNKLSRLNDSLRMANEAKTEFFSRLSHDMRTPMNGIMGMVSLSEDEDDPKVLKENIRKIKESGVYLLGLISDTLDMNKIESNKLVMAQNVVNGRQVIENICDMIRPTAKSKGVDFRPQHAEGMADCLYIADEVRLKQIFVNLLSNAVKFTPSGGMCLLRVEIISDSSESSDIRFVVSDTGVGMSEDFIKNKIFSPFSQEITSVAEQYAGSGLGLAIVRNLVELMGGNISVKSRLGEGTEFTVWLRLRKATEKEIAQNEERQQLKQEWQGGINVLLCEDHPLNAEIVERILTKKKCHVDWEKNGKDGLDKFSASTVGYYGAVIMDVRMPVMNGYESARHIRQLGREDSLTVPIIALTGDAFSEDVEKSRKSGMSAYLSKPVNTEKLFETLKELTK